MTDFRKRLWQSHNRKRANQRAAKERIRLERLAAIENAEQPKPRSFGRASSALFRITIRCRDGHSASFAVREGPFGLIPSATTAGRKLSTLIANYRPADFHIAIRKRVCNR